MISTPSLSSRSPRVCLWLLLTACAASCQPPPHSPSQGQASAPAATQAPVRSIPILTATVIKTYPHDPKAFTQGLEFADGHLYESTGRTGQSTLRECVLESGKVLRKVNLPENEFGEG